MPKSVRIHWFLLQVKIVAIQASFKSFVEIWAAVFWRNWNIKSVNTRKLIIIIIKNKIRCFPAYSCVFRGFCPGFGSFLFSKNLLSFLELIQRHELDYYSYGDNSSVWRLVLNVLLNILYSIWKYISVETQMSNIFKKNH